MVVFELVITVILLFKTVFQLQSLGRLLSTQWTFYLNYSQATAIAFNNRIR
jgi:polyferredoxin